MKVFPKADWLEEFSYEESLTILKDLSWSHIQEAGRFRDPLGALLRDGDWLALCNFELDYRYDDSVVSLGHARQALAYFQKWEPLELGVDKEKVALNKFLETEKQCRRTNQALKAVRRGELFHSSLTSSVLYLARRKIARVLGPVPSYEKLQFQFGPGATTNVRKKFACPAVKLAADFVCSRELFSSVSTLLMQAPRWALSNAWAASDEHAWCDVTIAPGKLRFVAKNAKTYRSIMTEPTLNGFAQQGIGRYLKTRLLKHGVDLSSQERNQRLAAAGSRSGSLATVDLSSASDTVSLELVAELLPVDWYSLLARFRTGTVRTRDGLQIELEKFSSMGNSYTFELESLIFWALSWAVLSHLDLPTGWLSVFGDDIIVPTEAYKPLVAVLSELGFLINQQKSFASGPFRESCGTDWFLGTDIRPAYVDTYLNGESLFVLHNFYMRSLDFRRARKVLKYIHPSLRIFGPDEAGDGHLIGSYSARTTKKSAADGWGGVYFDTFARRPRHLKRVPSVGCVLPTYSIYTREGAYDRLGSLGDQETDHTVVSGDEGYRRTTVYTLRRGVFLR